ncbi:MAG: GNAT family N-acetyltransferase [Reichenbachiella sp.]|uniref:GNAT family N-acetyltransferase n=1 Tax=Reichenbachiella sp. TaxID=2184521 RepID=UPI003264F84F
MKEILLGDQKELHHLMMQIYPRVYQHLWRDGGKSYLEKTYSPGQLEKELNEPNTLYCFVQYQSETIGIIRLLENEPVANFRNKKAAKLQRIYLSDAAQGKGVGKALMTWMQDRARHSGCSILWLEVMDTQQKAIGFYEGLGFQAFNEVKFESDLMHKHLRGMYQMWKTIL